MPTFLCLLVPSCSMMNVQMSRSLSGPELFSLQRFNRKDGTQVWLEGKGQAWQRAGIIEFVMVYRELLQPDSDTTAPVAGVRSAPPFAPGGAAGANSAWLGTPPTATSAPEKGPSTSSGSDGAANGAVQSAVDTHAEDEDDDGDDDGDGDGVDDDDDAGNDDDELDEDVDNDVDGDEGGETGTTPDEDGDEDGKDEGSESVEADAGGNAGGSAN